MSTKTVLEEQMHRLEKEIAADEAWIEYIESQVDTQSVTLKSVNARIDEMEAKIDDCIRIMQDLGRAVDAFRP